MSTNLLTCKERIAEQMASREEYIQELIDATNNTEDITGILADSAYDTLNELPLSIDTRQLTTITLSWGGPADYLDILHDGDDVQKVTYRFEDWFDGASEPVQTNSPLWDYAVSVIDSLQS